MRCVTGVRAAVRRRVCVRARARAAPAEAAGVNLTAGRVCTSVCRARWQGAAF